MWALLGLLSILLLIFVCKKLSRLSFRAAVYLDGIEERKLYNERCIRESLADIKKAVTPPEEEVVGYTERLLLANQKIAEKNQLSEAIKNELGIL